MEREPRHESIDERLKQEILTMVEEDQKMRKGGDWDPDVDRRNTERMKEIIGRHGWPGKALVGEEASNGAWLLVQHADHDLAFQKQALELLKDAVRKGEAEKQDEAYLIDRVKVNSGEPQVFGTQFDKDTEGGFGHLPIEDKGHLEERRAAYGLGPFAEYERRMQEANKELEKKEKGEGNI